jgi:hypothetical protein
MMYYCIGRQNGLLGQFWRVMSILSKQKHNPLDFKALDPNEIKMFPGKTTGIENISLFAVFL